MASATRPSCQSLRTRLGSSSTSLSPKTVNAEGHSLRRNLRVRNTSRFIPSGALSTMKTSGVSASAVPKIKLDRRSVRVSKSIGILLGS